MPPDSPDWSTHHKAGQAAVRRGDLAAAESALDAGFAAAGAGRAPIPLVLLRADWLLAAARSDEAKAYLETEISERPGVLWLYHKAAELAHARGETAAAWAHLATALAMETARGAPALRLLAAKIWLAEDQPETAMAVLEALAQANPTDIWGLLELARLHAAAGRPRVAATKIAAARERAPERRDLALRHGQYLAVAGAAAEAAAVYAAFLDDQGPDAEMTLRLIQCHKAAGAPEKALTPLATALAAAPLDPGLLQEMFRTHANLVAAPAMAEALARLQGRIPEDLADALAIEGHLATMDYDAALVRLRARPKARRSGAEAHQMATALIGAGQFERGLRYLRFCLRRWPGPGFLGRYVTHGLRLGRAQAVAEALAAYSADLPPRVHHGHRITLAGYRGDFETVVREFAALQALGAVTHAQKMQLARMIFIWLDPADSEAFFARIPHPFAGSDKPMHRGGLPGQMMQEFELERRALPADAAVRSPLDWMRDRPGSTMAAIRLIDQWRAGSVPIAQAPGDPVPQQIFQYWDAPDLPSSVQTACATWQTAPGFAYRRFTKVEALAYLRAHFEPGYVQAFRLAQNAAQEADFLRLCLLAREGGVWADADDRLYGSLETVLSAGQHAGLILYREPQGAALGNNFIATPPEHPVIRHAARLASMALRRRDNETTWSKTGPGLLTRAVGHYLARKNPERPGARITVLDWTKIARHIGMHNEMPYKRTPAHWNAAQTSGQTALWEALLEALARDGDRA